MGVYLDNERNQVIKQISSSMVSSNLVGSILTFSHTDSFLIRGFDPRYSTSNKSISAARQKFSTCI